MRRTGEARHQVAKIEADHPAFEGSLGRIIGIDHDTLLIERQNRARQGGENMLRTGRAGEAGDRIRRKRAVRVHADSTIAMEPVIGCKRLAETDLLPPLIRFVR